MTSVLKISVLASGAVYLDGEQVSLERLRVAVEGAKAGRPVVWYHREAPGGEPPPAAMEVMKLVVENRLPISLCSKPDFSDYVDLKGVSHSHHASWDSVMGEVREKTAGGRYVAIVRPDRTYLLIAPPPRDSMPPQMIQGMEKMVPPRPPRMIAAVADTYFAWKSERGVPSLAEAGQAIPFFGMLLGMACIGHSVVVYPGTADSLAAGCKGADLLIVDGAQIPSLLAEWNSEAGAVMRSRNIVVHDRASFKLTPQ